jgi:hypothetical protein
MPTIHDRFFILLLLAEPSPNPAWQKNPKAASILSGKACKQAPPMLDWVLQIGTPMNLNNLKILFVAGFGPITTSAGDSKALYLDTLGLPLKPMPGNDTYWFTELNQLEGVKHFALWPLEQASQSCFGTNHWPDHLPIPQAWLEFDVADITLATQQLKDQGCRLLVGNRQEPWGQTVTRFLSPEGLLLGITHTPWLRERK